MEWQRDTSGNYTLLRGTCEASVSQRLDSRWAARVSGRSMGTMRNFDTLEAAQDWCRAELAMLSQAGKCGPS
jgi:hypothetical protein